MSVGLEVCTCDDECHLHPANQSVIVILCGEMLLVSLALPPNAIQSLAREHGSLKNG